MSKLRNFHSSLGVPERAMLETVLERAQARDTAGYGYRFKRYGDLEGQHGERGDAESEGGRGWNDLIGWIEEQGDDDTQGFGFKFK